MEKGGEGLEKEWYRKRRVQRIGQGGRVFV